MADVIWLQTSERPAETRSFALVAADATGGPVSDTPVAEGKAVVFYIPQMASEAERSDAIARARTWAERNAIDVIYVEAN